jgi:hypothetical protein
VLIEAYGDDAMYGLNPAVGAPYAFNTPADLQTLLQNQFGDRVTVSNQGAPGSTLATLMAGSDGNHLPFDQQMARSKANIVIVNHGVNDSAWGGEDVMQFRALLTQFVATAERHGKIVVLEEPGPVCSANYNVAPYVAATDATATQTGSPLIPQYQAMLAIPNWQSHYSGGCYYPDPYIYSAKAPREAVVLAPIISQILR